MEWKRNSLRFTVSKPLPLFYSVSIFFFSISALFCCSAISFTATCPDGSCTPFSAKADPYFQESDKMISMSMEKREEGALRMRPAAPARRYLSGIGSSPPRCLWKCGNCTPCKPVHVPVPPGTPVTAEYYPEAWRCKCGNKLYMP